MAMTIMAKTNSHGQENFLVESRAYTTRREGPFFSQWLIQNASLVRTIYEGLGDPVLVYPIAARVAEGVLGPFLDCEVFRT
jgi:hypothetical protein